MSGLFYWILDRLIAFLANLNPERAARVESIKAQAAKLDAERDQLLTWIKESQVENARLTEEFNRNIEKRQALENAIAITKTQAQKAKDELDKLTGGDRVRIDL